MSKEYKKFVQLCSLAIWASAIEGEMPRARLTMQSISSEQRIRLIEEIRIKLDEVLKKIGKNLGEAVPDKDCAVEAVKTLRGKGDELIEELQEIHISLLSQENN